MTEHESDKLHTSILALMNEETGLNAGEFLSSCVDAETAEPRMAYSRLLSNFVHQEFSEQEALEHWAHIIENSYDLRQRLGRKVGLHLAIVDYFTNFKPILKSPILIEINLFRSTERLAMIDGLTGAFNRRYMDIVLKKEFNRSERYAKELSLCILDIDNFKKINDSKGHVFGDRVLRELSKLLRESVREEDIVCRYGGEEFLVILPETEAEGVGILAERIRLELKKRPFFSENGVTFSAGTSTYPSSGRDIETLIKAADSALYQAKFSGKDRVVAAGSERRRFGRYPRSWELEIFPDENCDTLTGIVTRNVSLGGVQFECPVRYSIDTSLQLVFTNLDLSVPDVKTEGRITWVKKNRNTYRYGVSFVDTPRLIEARLQVDPMHMQEVM